MAGLGVGEERVGTNESSEGEHGVVVKEQKEEADEDVDSDCVAAIASLEGWVDVVEVLLLLLLLAGSRYFLLSLEKTLRPR